MAYRRFACDDQDRAVAPPASRYSRRKMALTAAGVVAAVVLGRGSIETNAGPRSSTPAPKQAVAAPAAAPSVAAQVAAAPPAPVGPLRVVIVSEDGLRPDVLVEQLDAAPLPADPRRHAPHARPRTIRESDTLPSHAAMLSGVGAEAHGLWWNSYQPQRGFIHVPTVFSVAHANGLSTAMIVGKPKLRHIAMPGTVDHFERPSYLCGGVAKRAGAYFTAAKPDLMFVHFSDPDEYGHSHGWMSPEYLQGRRQQRQVPRDAARRRSTHRTSRRTTVVIVTADHGGHGKHHSGKAATPVDRRHPWIMRGPASRRPAHHRRADRDRRHRGDDARRARSRQGAEHAWLVAHQVRAHDAAGRSLTREAPHADPVMPGAVCHEGRRRNLERVERAPDERAHRDQPVLESRPSSARTGAFRPSPEVDHQSLEEHEHANRIIARILFSKARTDMQRYHPIVAGSTAGRHSMRTSTRRARGRERASIEDSHEFARSVKDNASKDLDDKHPRRRGRRERGARPELRPSSTLRSTRSVSRTIPSISRRVGTYVAISPTGGATFSSRCTSTQSSRGNVVSTSAVGAGNSEPKASTTPISIS